MYAIINERKVKNVKNTMIDNALAFMAPHLCCGCGKLAGLLCDHCKHDIVNDTFSGCIGCGRPAGLNGVCSRCDAPYSRAWCVGERSGVLEELIDQYKFERVREAGRVSADLIAARLPDLPEGIVIVPVPTLPSHIRQRGYDHTLLLAKALGRRIDRPVATPLVRVTKTMQRGASKKLRLDQAKAAFRAKTVDTSAIYLWLMML